METTRLANEVAVVTGSASGIGKEVAVLLAKNGAKVACLDINERGLDATVSAIREKGGEAMAIALDLAKSPEVKAAMARTSDAYGGITILVNAAAIINYQPFEETTDELWNTILGVNIGGYFYCLREAYPYLKKSGNGKVVQFSSSTGFSGSGFANVAYATSKSAAVGLTKYAAGLMGKDGIRVNAICPGLTETPIITKEDGTVRRKTDYEKVIPLGRIAEPADMANVVLFLVSEESAYMTGEVLHVNGGKYMYHL
jgi:NAD(P)-dependent dehydrogenase (short-subunit alcohol dehydrogenase family)